MIAALADDLNTAGALARLHEMARALPGPTAPAFVGSAQLLGLLTPELGAWATAAPDLTALADRLAALRAAAKQSRDFAPVDALKAALISAGVEVRMTASGVDLVAGPGFDPARLPEPV